MKKYIILVLLLTILLTASSCSKETLTNETYNGDIKVILDGTNLDFSNEKPIGKDGIIYLPYSILKSKTNLLKNTGFKSYIKKINNKDYISISNIPYNFFLSTDWDGDKGEVILKSLLSDYKGYNVDTLMWYDIDHGNPQRPDHGWWNLNPWHPEKVEKGSLYRVTDPIIGLYDCSKRETAIQHAYFMSSLGVDTVAADLTNIMSPFSSGQGAQMMSYYKFVYDSYENMLKTYQEIKDFTAPKVYPTIRMNGDNFKTASDLLNDLYKLYSNYQNSWYKFDDSGNRKDKPFVVIFADGNVLNEWAKAGKIPYDDERFNIRWSNGFLPGGAPLSLRNNSDNSSKIPENIPFWLFVENQKDLKRNGYYKPFYKEGKNGSVEQMTAWASVWLGGNDWDGLLNKIDNKETFTRYMEPVFKYKPKALLVNRFNYSVAWYDQPQEGLSLLDSTHIEPNVDFGFKVFDIVADNLYTLKGKKRLPPDAPEVFAVSKSGIKFDLKDMPTQYRVSNDPYFRNCEWKYVNAVFGVQQLGDSLGDQFYLQVRNSFGISTTSKININDL